MTKDENFKICPMCSHEWKTREDFMNDPSLEINGYLADFEELEWSQFYFTHNIKGCFSTLTIMANEFVSLYSGKRYTERMTAKEGCPRHCFEKENLARCDAICECAFNREIIQIIKERQKGKL